MTDIAIRPERIRGVYASTTYILGPAFQGSLPGGRFSVIVDRNQKDAQLPARWAQLMAHNNAPDIMVNALHNLFLELFQDERVEGVILENHQAHPTLAVHYTDSAMPRRRVILRSRHRHVKAALATFLAIAGAIQP